MDKSRGETVTISGEHVFTIVGSGSGPTPVSKDVQISAQRTRSYPTGFPIVRRFLKGAPELSGDERRRLEHFITHSDFGAPFRTEKSSVESTLHDVHVSSNWGGNMFTYYGLQNGPVLLASSTPFGLQTESAWDQYSEQLWGKGSAAIARSRPGKPGVDLAVAIGELKKDGIPSMIGSLFGRARTVKDIFREGGNEYLNAQFGWVPLLRDVQRLAETASRSRQLLEQYERDVTRLIRRRYHFDPTTETTSGRTMSTGSYAFMPGTPLAALTTSNVKPYGVLDQVEEVNQITTKSWFSGGFRYYFPDVSEGLEYFARIEREANTLLGTRLDPEVLWNLQPWTWLIDWFVNVGDMMSNTSAIMADGLVMQYGYLMETKTITQRVTMPGIFIQTEAGFQRSHGPWSVTRSSVRKARVKASPFGFGLNPDSFSESQWAILGALGISRGLR